MDNAKIEIGKAVKGRRPILVNGEQWGHIAPESHGSRGATYTFFQGPQAILITRPAPSVRFPNGTSRHTVSIPGDIAAKRHNRDHASVQPLEHRLLAKAQELLASGHLRDPKVIRAEKQAADEKHRQREQEAIERKRGEFRAHAMEVLGIPAENAVDLDSNENRLLDQIVECMEWSQSR